MRYQNFHVDKPEIGPVYFICPTGKETLGFFKGAAWFESQLIDYDVYSNQGNWLYIAGKGTDPRGGRPFNVAKQTQDHDPSGKYRQIWSTSL